MSTKSIPAKRWIRIIPAAFLMYTIAFMDRNNMAFAFSGMEKDLAIGATAFGIASGVFFLGYLFLQVPGGLLAQRWSAKKFITISLVAWGVCSVLTGFVENYFQLLIVRFMVGFAEGGVSPATMIMLIKWFPLNERARANGYWYLCIPFASIITAPLSGWILSYWDWRMLFIIEGFPPIIWAIIWWFMTSDSPNDAKWLSKEERDYLNETLKREKEEIKKVAPKSFKEALKNRNVIILLLLFCFLQIGFYGYGLWLPTLIKSISTSSSMMTIGWLAAIPWIFAAVGSIINSYHSDKTGDYRNHIGIPILCGAFFLTISVLFGDKYPILALIALCLCLGFIYCYSVYWAALSSYVAEDTLAASMGFINAIGNLGGFIGPFAVGYLIDVSGSMIAGECLLIGALILAGCLAFRLKK